MSEYPDHLNPFNKDSGSNKLGRTLTRSFRGLKGLIRQSFRRKKTLGEKNDACGGVEFRKKTDDAVHDTLRSNVFSLPSSPTYNSYVLSSPPLPRSRFKERLSRQSLNENRNSYDERCNPFADYDDLNPFEEPPVPHRRRKSKKKAPMPNSSSVTDVGMGFAIKGTSKWSLTSTETDYTIDDRSETSYDHDFSKTLRDCLDNFKKEMDALNSESYEVEKYFTHVNNSRDNQISISNNENITNGSIECTCETNNNENKISCQALENCKNSKETLEKSSTDCDNVNIFEPDIDQNHKGRRQRTNVEEKNYELNTERRGEDHGENRHSEKDDDIQGTFRTVRLANERELNSYNTFNKSGQQNDKIFPENLDENVENQENKKFSLAAIEMNYIDEEDKISIHPVETFSPLNDSIIIESQENHNCPTLS